VWSGENQVIKLKLRPAIANWARQIPGINIDAAEGVMIFGAE
jgi:hypothetical protein